jgi:hypothetical protein
MLRGCNIMSLTGQNAHAAGHLLGLPAPLICGVTEPAA